MTRISIIEKLTKQVQAEAERSTCSRLNVGALIYDSRGVILSSGYNGALASMPHCDHECDCGLDQDGEPFFRHANACVSVRACTNTLHAEANAILWAARRGVATEGQNLITTHLPCYRCAQLIVQAGIASVTYLGFYRTDDGLILLSQAGVSVNDRVTDEVGQH